MITTKKYLFPLLFCVLFSLTSCNIPAANQPDAGQTETAQAALTNAVTPSPEPSPTATPVPPRNLVICLEQEPESLYLYGSSSRSTVSVLESIYDGPFDVIDYQAQPVILEKMPSYADGDAVFQPVSVYDGDPVVDVDGSLVSLKTGVKVLPSGCTSRDCAVAWDGSSDLQMDQEWVTFTLKPGIVWSDGVQLTAADSVYSYKLAGNENTPVSHQLVYRTQKYSAVDELHIQWVGVPGFFPERLDTIFWSPLPEHAWAAVEPADLLTNDMSAKYPVGWGPYIIEKWVTGDHIQLKKNPLYFRASEGLPVFDNVVYRFLGREGDSLLAALESRECDLIDQSSSLESRLIEIRDLEQQGILKTHIQTGPEWEQLVFGIKPQSYDDGYSVFSGDRPDFFSDVRVRQAFAFCIDRQKIAGELLQGLSKIPSTYLPDGHPLQDADARVYPYDPEQGLQLLNQAGWIDWDADPETPLQSVGNPTIQDGTFFSVNYFTTQAALRQQIAGVIKESLAGCGIEVNVTQYTPEEMYTEGAGGLLFGRNFDLAQFAWSSGVLPPCEFYIGSQIPSAANNWLTLNIGGYLNAAYDSACQSSLTVRPDQIDSYSALQKQAQNLFSDELPVLPLYSRLKIALARPDLCGLSSEGNSQSLLWNIEELDYGENCKN